MGVYNATGFYTVIVSGSNVFYPGGGYNPLALALDDGGDGTFTAGEIVVAGNSYTFRGSMDIGGVEYPVFARNGNDLDSFAFVDSASVPEPAVGSVAMDTGAFTTCFAEGTRIATPAGDIAVEQLSVGAPILTADGRVVRCKWIGRQTVSTRFFPAETRAPVRISAGCLGDGLPHRDLTVTADHALLMDGVLCHAGALVNGTTITRVPPSEMGERYTVYHVETDAHEIILANGAPAETFIDNVSRRVFDNYAEFETLYGDVPEMEELPLPRAMSARQIPSHVRNRLAARAVA